MISSKNEKSLRSASSRSINPPHSSSFSQDRYLVIDFSLVEPLYGYCLYPKPYYGLYIRSHRSVCAFYIPSISPHSVKHIVVNLCMFRFWSMFFQHLLFIKFFSILLMVYTRHTLVKKTDKVRKSTIFEVSLRTYSWLLKTYEKEDEWRVMKKSIPNVTPITFQEKLSRLLFKKVTLI